jgi:DNA-binding transcriptional MerR regulator
MTRARATTDAPRKRPRTAVASNGSDRQIKIGEAARLIGVEAYVLRFWETQFPFLRPRHSRSKHRYYDQKSIAALHLIRRLLHSDGYTIAGAKKHIREIGLDRLCGEGATASQAEPATHDQGSKRQTTLRETELSRSTQNKLVAIRNELKSLQRLLAG